MLSNRGPCRVYCVDSTAQAVYSVDMATDTDHETTLHDRLAQILHDISEPMNEWRHRHRSPDESCIDPLFFLMPYTTATLAELLSWVSWMAGQADADKAMREPAARFKFIARVLIQEIEYRSADGDAVIEEHADKKELVLF